MTITGLDPGTSYAFGAAYSNASGNSDTVCSTGETPDTIATEFNADTILLDIVENNRDTTPWVSILVKRPATAIGALNYSGIFYTGDPASAYAGNPLFSGYFYRHGPSRLSRYEMHDRYRIQATLPSVSTELWLSTLACIKNPTTTYTSQPVNFNIWEGLTKPQDPQFRISRILASRIYFAWDELGYSESGRGNDSISNYSHELYYVTTEGEYQLLKTIPGTSTVRNKTHAHCYSFPQRFFRKI